MNAPDETPRDLEDVLRRRLRLIAGFTFLGLVTILALADTFGRQADLRVSEFIFGSIMGGLLLIAGVEGASRIASWMGGGKR